MVVRVATLKAVFHALTLIIKNFLPSISTIEAPAGTSPLKVTRSKGIIWLEIVIVKVSVLPEPSLVAAIAFIVPSALAETNPLILIVALAVSTRIKLHITVVSIPSFGVTV